MNALKTDTSSDEELLTVELSTEASGLSAEAAAEATAPTPAVWC